MENGAASGDAQLGDDNLERLLEVVALFAMGIMFRDGPMMLPGYLPVASGRAVLIETVEEVGQRVG